MDGHEQLGVAERSETDKQVQKAADNELQSTLTENCNKFISKFRSVLIQREVVCRVYTRYGHEQSGVTERSDVDDRLPSVIAARLHGSTEIKKNTVTK